MSDGFAQAKVNSHEHISEHATGGASQLSPPTVRLLVGLLITLAAVAIFSAFSLEQIQRLRDLQTQIVDRNRRDSLQLLRIQDNLHSLALAMRDMLSGDEPYGLVAWRSQVERHHADLDDAFHLESELAPAARPVERQQYLANALNQFWLSVNRMFTLAEAGQKEQALNLIRTSLEPQQASISNAVARLLVQNNETEQQAVASIQALYTQAERNVYYFLFASLVAISLTSIYLILFTRRLFARLARLSTQRSDLARKLITVQEELLRSISRELHDEFGQILTAIGALLTRIQRKSSAAQPGEVTPGTEGTLPLTTKRDLAMQADILEVREIAQGALEKVRSLSQMLHPSVLDDGGLEKAIDWYLPVFQKQTGIEVHYEKTGESVEVPDSVGIHVYRVLQEALNNVARHSKAANALVRLSFIAGRAASARAGYGAPERIARRISLEVEDHGVGLPAEKLSLGKSGIGLVAMRERADLLNGSIDFAQPPEGGTIVRLEIPLPEILPYEKSDFRSAGR